MMSLSLYDESGSRLICTHGPEINIALSVGEYTVDDNLRETLSVLWDMTEYIGDLTLVVENG